MADEVKLSDLDTARSRIFSSKQFKRKPLTFFGVDIELRQPSIAAAFQTRPGDEPRIAIIGTLIDCAFLPGTNIKVFSEADYDSLAELPFDKDFVDATQAISELTGTNLLVTADSSKSDQ